MSAAPPRVRRSRQGAPLARVRARARPVHRRDHDAGHRPRHGARHADQPAHVDRRDDPARHRVRWLWRVDHPVPLATPTWRRGSSGSRARRTRCSICCCVIDPFLGWAIGIGARLARSPCSGIVALPHIVPARSAIGAAARATCTRGEVDAPRADRTARRGGALPLLRAARPRAAADAARQRAREPVAAATHMRAHPCRADRVGCPAARRRSVRRPLGLSSTARAARTSPIVRSTRATSSFFKGRDDARCARDGAGVRRLSRRTAALRARDRMPRAQSRYRDR